MLDTTIYNKKEFQETLIALMISDDTSFVRIRNILQDGYFADHLRPVVRMIKDHSEKYNSVPAPELIKAETGFSAQIIPNIDLTTTEWFLDNMESFCRYRALENIIHAGPDILAKGQGADLEKQIKDALTISLVTDLGSSFFEGVRERIEARRDRSNYVSTGFKTLDRKLGGGFTRGSLNIFAGGSGSGKSIFLQNIALNWALAGMNVIYISLELSETLVNERLEAMVTQFKTNELIRNVDDVVYKIARLHKGAKGSKPGDLKIKRMSEAGTTTNAIKAYLKEYEIETGRRPDGVVIDYLDLMYPNNAKVDTNNVFNKDKHVSEEMRSIGNEWDIPIVSASQLNRSSVEAQEFDHSHISGGISKINSCDNLFGIFTSLTMRENGKYEIQFLKTRSAAVTGHKIHLGYDVGCMRLSDLLEEDSEPEQDNKAISQLAVSGSQVNNPSQTVSSANTSAQAVHSLLDSLRLGTSDVSDE